VKVLISLIEAMSVFLTVSYVFCSTGALPLGAGRSRLRVRNKVALYFFFTAVAIMGNYLGIRVQGGAAIANTRAVGSVLAGLLGGPVLGVAVGLTSGLQRLPLGGSAALPGAVATTLEGMIAGLVHIALRRRPDLLVRWKTAALVTAVGEVVHQLIVLALVEPRSEAIEIVKVIGVPMVLANSLGAALFMVVYQSRQDVFDRIGAASSELALRIAERTTGLMARGYGRAVAGELADIIRAETGVGAVGITDSQNILAWSGMGADHHVPGREIFSPWTFRALSTRQVVFVDGVREPFACPLEPKCPTGSAR